MFKKLIDWWKHLNKVERELNAMGIYYFPGYFGQTFILRADNDKQKTNKRTSKKSKG